MRSKPIPIACTLDHASAVDQLDEWATLRDQAASRQVVPHGVRLTFPRSLLATVEDLARREQSCCAFLDIEVDLAGPEVVLEITAENSQAGPVIAAIAGISPG